MSRKISRESLGKYSVQWHPSSLYQSQLYLPLPNGTTIIRAYIQFQDPKLRQLALHVERKKKKKIPRRSVILVATRSCPELSSRD